MKLGATDLIHEDKGDGNQKPPPPVKVEEEFLEEGDTNDMVLVVAVSMAGVIIITRLVTFAYHLYTKCKKSESMSLEDIDVRDDAKNLLRSLEDDQKMISALVARMDAKKARNY